MNLEFSHIDHNFQISENAHPKFKIYNKELMSNYYKEYYGTSF